MQKNMKSQFSLAGMKTYFDVGDHVIEVYLSSFSGKEVVSVDGRVVSRARNWRYNSKHDFTLDKARYRVEVTIISIMKGRSRIDLYRNGEYVDHDEIDWKAGFGNDRKKTSIAITVLVMVASAGLGGLFGYYGIAMLMNLFGFGDAA